MEARPAAEGALKNQLLLEKAVEGEAPFPPLLIDRVTPDAAGVANRRFRPRESGFFNACNALGEDGGRDRD